MTDTQRAAWEDWGRVDPFWAVLTDGERRGGWDVDAFFRTGEEAAGWALSRAEAFGLPAERALQESGVESIERLDLCTSCRADDFFSHRRDGGLTGRQGVIGYVA